MEYGLIGQHLPHSFSKEIHGLCADYDYRLTELSPEEVAPFFRAGNFKAVNVTIPYKQTVIPLLSWVDAEALAVGAVNTVVNRDGKLYGYNTDVYGMGSALARGGISLSGKKVLILGSGGTSLTARAVAKGEGAREILTVGRTAGKADLTYARAYEAHSDAEIIINTTPCGMYPHGNGSEEFPSPPVDLSRFPRLTGVFDAVYNPLRTDLILQARALGIPAEGGLYMLAAQGVKASRIFLGKDGEGLTAEVERVYRTVEAEKENIILVGMPGCGKTTVGQILAQKTGRRFYDTDAEVVALEGMSIPEIFATRGEARFRELETRVIAHLSAEVSGAVISTGGGAVLREENVGALKKTGRIYFLDRPLQDLIPTADRPLSPDRETLAQRYHERYPRYCAVCDLRIPVTGGADETAETLRKDFEV